jgi:flagellar biosynthesis/type III secretory pathway M-ring protein FliF/YscJ
LISLLISSFLFLIENLSFPTIIKGAAELLSFLVLFIIMTRIVKPLSKEETELLARAAKRPIISKLIRKFLS